MRSRDKGGEAEPCYKNIGTRIRNSRQNGSSAKNQPVLPTILRVAHLAFKNDPIAKYICQLVPDAPKARRQDSHKLEITIANF